MPELAVPAPQRGWPAALARAVALALHVLHGLWIVQWRFARWDEIERRRCVQAWARSALAILGVEVRSQGVPAARGCLVVANHVSWLDILAIDAVAPCRFVAKADVHRWPLLGALVAGAGTLFIERTSRRDALRVVHQLAERLQAGDVLAFFPEGTTSDGRSVLPFHANLLQAPLAVDAPVQPLGLAYRPKGAARQGAQRHEAPVYVGSTTLLASLWRVLRAADVAVELHWGQPQQAQGRDRRRWAADLRAEIARLAGLAPPVVAVSHIGDG